MPHDYSEDKLIEQTCLSSALQKLVSNLQGYITANDVSTRRLCLQKY